MRTLILFLLLSSTCQAQQLVMSSKDGLVGDVAKNIVERRSGYRPQYTHSAIELNGWVYEMDYPVAKKTPVQYYGKPRTTNDYYQLNLSQDQINRMQAYAESRLGEPYRLRNYFHPNSRKIYGTWCSPFVGEVLNSGGYNLTRDQVGEPQKLYNTLKPRFLRRTYR